MCVSAFKKNISSESNKTRYCSPISSIDSDEYEVIDSVEETIVPVHELENINVVNNNVDEVIEYSTEADLLEILKTLNPDVRIIGTDWKGKPYTGHELPIKMYWHVRDHDWSTSGLRKRVYEMEKEKL